MIRKSLQLLISIVFVLTLLLSPNAVFAKDVGCTTALPNCTSSGGTYTCYRGCGCPSAPGCTSGGYEWNGQTGTNCQMKEKDGSGTRECGCGNVGSCGGGTAGSGSTGNSILTDIRTPAKQLIPINTSLGDFFSRGISAIILVAGLIAFVFLLWGGIDWVISGGDKEKIQSARSKITNAIIGLAIVAVAWAVFLLIDYFFGIGLTA